MELMINLIIQNCYNEETDSKSKSKCVSDKMTTYYNKNKWSCIIGINYGYNIWKYVIYKYTYQDIDWIVFLGAY